MVFKLIATSIFLALTTTLVFSEEAEITKPELSQQNTTWVFGDVDKDHDMKVTVEELAAKGSTIEKFKKADLNNDGTLNKNEFTAYAAENK